MRVMVIAAAGMATRFNKDLDKPCLKCIYEELPGNSILCRILEKADGYDRFIIVGGYQFKELNDYIKGMRDDVEGRIEIVQNPYYNQYGTGYSLYLGLCVAETYHPCEIVFVEGDLYFDKDSFDKLTLVDRDAVTVTYQPVCADRSVAVYQDREGRLHYLYDTGHNSLSINQPFRAIFNSAQMWKFCNSERLFQCMRRLSRRQLEGTNLELIQEYYGVLEKDEYSIIKIDGWINCNTLQDYKEIFSERRGE